MMRVYIILALQSQYHRMKRRGQKTNLRHVSGNGMKACVN